MVDGGAGSDRLVLPSAALSLDLALVRASGRVADIEAIELRGNQQIILHADDIRPLTGGEDSFSLFTTASDRVELIGGWSEAALAPGTGYRQFSLGAEIVTIYGTGGVSIAAAPSAPGTGLDAIASGPAAPAIDSQPGIAAASPLSILSWYQLHGTETIEAYETWRSENGAPVVTSFVTSYSLINYGQIESDGTSGIAEALRPSNMDRFPNRGTVSASIGGNGTAYGFHSQSWGSLVNYGLVEASPRVDGQRRPMSWVIGTTGRISSMQARSARGTMAAASP